MNLVSVKAIPMFTGGLCLQVIFVQHIPPGKFEKHKSYHWFYPSHNVRFIELVRNFADVIGSMHSAHHHTDSFRVFYDNNGKIVAKFGFKPRVSLIDCHEQIDEK